MKVSVIVPVYNVEQYIERCAVSILEQSYNDLDIIFVNDCSTDKSIEVLKKVLNRFPKRESVRIINNSHNRGVAYVRNVGIEVALGEFIIWVDSDDWIEKNTVEQLVLEYERTNADIISFESKWYYQNRIEYHKIPDCSNPKEMLMSQLCDNIGSNIWGRFIRTSLYKDNNIRSSEGLNIGEDFQQLIPLIFFSKKISTLHLPLYNYERRNDNSYTFKYTEEKMRCSLMSYQYTYNVIPNRDDNLEKAFRFTLLDAYASHMIISCKINNDCYYKYIYSKIREIPVEYWKHVTLSKRILFYIKCYYLAFLYVRCMLFLRRIVTKR